VTARGIFLAFEGTEGVGKTTQVRRLAQHLTGRGRPPLLGREPGSTPLGEQVREWVLQAGAIPSRSELFLLLAARAAFVEQVVRPALDAGQVVIADRFELSTLAYQGAGRGLPLDEIRVANHLATGGMLPDATLLLEIAPEEGARRQAAAGKLPDRMERESVEFHARVAAGYRALADRVDNILPVDARGTQDAVHARVLDVLSVRFPETFAMSGVITCKTPPEES
jgi:dTMP kinase